MPGAGYLAPMADAVLVERRSTPTAWKVLDNPNPLRTIAHSASRALGQVDGAKLPLVKRPSTVTVLVSTAGIISCHVKGRTRVA